MKLYITVIDSVEGIEEICGYFTDKKFAERLATTIGGTVLTGTVDEFDHTEWLKFIETNNLHYFHTESVVGKDTIVGQQEMTLGGVIRNSVYLMLGGTEDIVVGSIWTTSQKEAAAYIEHVVEDIFPNIPVETTPSGNEKWYEEILWERTP